MAQLLTSLGEISTTYSIFEKDQVLTHEQLNGVSSYFNDELRLSRVSLSGVGIASGLHLTLAGSVRVSRGIGVTTDGDLVRFDQDAAFDRWKPYDVAAPSYAPFFSGENRAALFELVREGAADLRALPLADFAAQAGRSLEGMLALLLVESFVKDGDLCTSTDCDNLGKDAVCSVKLLLIDAGSAGPLIERVATPDAAARVLPHVTAARPSLANVAFSGTLVARYQAACVATQNQLRAALTALYPACASFVADLFPVDPAQVWNAKLDAQLAELQASDRTAVQYYYDFLKDLTETYNAFRAQLFGQRTWCCPEPTAFSKHLLLGTLQTEPVWRELAPRTPFYPSPLEASRCAELEHARFLLERLDMQIAAFAIPAASGAVRITPSRFEDSAPEQRAIPYYYAVAQATPIHERWSYALTRQGMARHNYSYNASAYQAEGGAASPLTAQLGAFSFFRIEGHLDAPVADVVTSLEEQIKERNLPFAVRAVQIAAAPAAPPRRPPTFRPKRFTPLRLFHQTTRLTLAQQLMDADRFSGVVKTQVQRAITDRIVTDAPEDGGLSLQQTTDQRTDVVKAKSRAAATKLAAPYAAYRQDVSWKADVSDARDSASELLSGIGQLATRTSVTPFDTLIAPQLRVQLGILDGLIDAQDTREEEKLKFAAFLADHPSLEHFAGVTRGGTFVLVYDSVSERVVSDFMLPYICCAEDEKDEPVEPPVVIPQDENDDDPKIYERVPPLRLFPPKKLFREDITGMQRQIDSLLGEIKGQATYLHAFGEVLGTRAGALVTAGNPATTPGTAGGLASTGLIRNAVLDSFVQETETKAKRVDFLREKLITPEIDDASRAAITVQLNRAEGELATSIEDTTRFVADANIEVAAGSDGHAALSAVSQNLGKVRDTGASERLNNNLGAIGNAAAPNVRAAIGRITR